MKLRRAVLISLWLATAGLPVLAAAQGAEPARLRVAGAPLSMDQAVKMVEQRYHARVVKAETQKDGGRSVYVLRLLDASGKVWTVRVNAADGALQ
jgi:uncharacterized membrane protein YkoI